MSDDDRVELAVVMTEIKHLTALVEKTLADHECRLRGLERQSPWRTLAEAVTGIIAVVSVALGFRSAP